MLLVGSSTVEKVAAQWLDRMFEPCGVYRVVREHGVVVDFERTFLNGAGRVLLLTLAGDESVTSMVEEAPNVVEQGLFEQYVRVAETGIPWTGLSQPYSDDRRSVVLDVQVWRVPDGIAITYRDVTERERLAHELAVSEQRFRAIFENLPEAISVMQAVEEDGEVVDFRWLYVNELQAAMLGFPAERFLGHRVRDLLPGERSAAFVQSCVEVMRSGEPWRRPTVWYDDIQLGGSPRRRAFDVTVSPVEDGCVIVSRDVTDLRPPEEQDPGSGPEPEPAG